MEQKKLEERVEELFRQQGFQIEKKGDVMEISGEGVDKKVQIFSSEFDENDIIAKVEPGALVFLDEEVQQVQYDLENDVSVITERGEENEYDLPSHEIIGDIALINQIGDKDAEEVKEGILHYNPHVKTILLKQEPLSGEFRTGGYEKLYGDDTETTHKEFGCRYRVDPTKAYFSERLATERKRVADQVNAEEKVLVIGAGVGPYPVLIARESGAEVVAVEKNPEAVKFLRENIELNNVSDRVTAIEADALELELDESFDRVVIAVPEFGDKFLENAFKHLQENGVIYYYRFREDQDWSPLIEEIESVAERVGIAYDIQGKHVCGDRGPSVDRVCIEIERK